MEEKDHVHYTKQKEYKLSEGIYNERITILLNALPVWGFPFPQVPLIDYRSLRIGGVQIIFTL